MWNFCHTNHICYLRDFKKENNSYKKRLNKMKPFLKISSPYLIKNNNKGYSYEKYKTKYDNKILSKKTKEINKSKGFYNQEVLRPNSSFSWIRNSNFENYLRLERKSIYEDNEKMKRRLRNAKPIYSVEKMRKDALNHNKYRKFLLEVLRKNRLTPLFNDEMENILNV